MHHNENIATVNKWRDASQWKYCYSYRGSDEVTKKKNENDEPPLKTFYTEAKQSFDLMV